MHAVMLRYREIVLQEAGRALLPLCERSTIYRCHGLYTDALGVGGAVGVEQTNNSQHTLLI